MMNPQKSKTDSQISQHLRAEKLSLRDTLSDEVRQFKSDAMFRKLTSLREYAQADSILYFMNFRSEIATIPIIQKALADGVLVSLPLTITKPRALRAYGVHNLHSDVQLGYQDIPEPNPDICQEIAPTSLDVVIVPGSVFDKRGGRMGYGGGYYDRFLAHRAPQAIRIGVCFELQMEDKIALEPHDQLLDFIVTEDCVYNCFRGKAVLYSQ